jgi:hypothetical protein
MTSQTSNSYIYNVRALDYFLYGFIGFVIGF